jgi:uncharacterized coiled-coil protein SlyX
MECEFCKKTFSTKYLLTQHQKKTKYCLDIQGEQSIFECNFCHKHLSTKDRLIVHTNSCKEKTRHEYTEKELLIKKEFDERLKLSENIIQEKNEYISKLEAKIEKMEAKLEAKLEKFENAVVTNMAATTHVLEAKAVKAAQAATTTTNNTLNTNITVNNFLNLSQEHVKKVLSERLNYNVVYAGQAGLATFVFDNILKDAAGKLIYRCVDASRQMFEFVDENGETVRDMKAEKLTQSLLKGDVIKLGLEAAAVGWNTENEKLNTERVGVFGPKVNEYADLNRNNTVFRAKVSSLTT